MFPDDMILHAENPKDYTHTKKLLELINKLSKVAGHKVNMQKSFVWTICKGNYKTSSIYGSLKKFRN